MKSLISVIETMLKRLTHREMSPSDLEKARRGVIDIYETQDSIRAVKYKMIYGKPHLEIDYKRKNFIVEPYFASATHYIYDEDGKIIEKLDVIEGETHRGVTIRQFDPPGRWRGKKVEKSRNYGDLINS